MIEKSVVFIEGSQLAELMIRHNLGVAVKNYYIKDIDTDYFSDNKKLDRAKGNIQSARVSLGYLRTPFFRRFSITSTLSPVSMALELATARIIRLRDILRLALSV
jgi:hypothetical protein